MAFWTGPERNVASIIWDGNKGLPGTYVDVRSTDDNPKRVKFKRCGVKTQVLVVGFEAFKHHALPAWPCKYAKK